MSTLIFNANEVFDIAKRIERNGAAFYKAAADVVTDDTSKKIMNDLREMEVHHETIFSSMQKELSGAETEETLYDPHDEAFQFLKGMAEKYVFSQSEDPEQAIPPGATVVDVIQEGIRREQDSIVFYEGIKVMVPEKYGRSHIDEIIAQEMGHLMLLTQELDRVQKK